MCLGIGMIFPAAATEAEYKAIEQSDLLPGVAQLCQHLGLPVTQIEPFAEGSLPVFAIGQSLVLKLFPPVYGDELPVEAGVMQALEGRLSLPTPALEAAGVFGGWGYVLMERMHGMTLRRAWPHLSTVERERLGRQLGVALAELHAIAPPELTPMDGLPFAGPYLEPLDWTSFVAEQRAECVVRQKSKGLEEQWLAQIPSFLDSADLTLEKPSLLHTEFMDTHVLVSQQTGDWQLSGLFDFEPAMQGAPEYDFVAFGVFISRGEAAVFRAMTEGYAYPAGDLDGLPNRVMAYTLLHVYSNVPWYLREVPAGEVTSFEELARVWFGNGKR